MSIRDSENSENSENSESENSESENAIEGELESLSVENQVYLEKKKKKPSISTSIASSYKTFSKIKEDEDIKRAQEAANRAKTQEAIKAGLSGLISRKKELIEKQLDANEQLKTFEQELTPVLQTIYTLQGSFDDEIRKMLSEVKSGVPGANPRSQYMAGVKMKPEKLHEWLKNKQVELVASGQNPEQVLTQAYISKNTQMNDATVYNQLGGLTNEGKVQIIRFYDHGERVVHTTAAVGDHSLRAKKTVYIAI